MSEIMKYKGKSVEEAIAEACRALNLPSDELDIEVVSAGSAGIFGLCKKQAVISVTRKIREEEPADAAAAEQPPEPEPEPEIEADAGKTAEPVAAEPVPPVEKIAEPEKPVAAKPAKKPAAAKEKKERPAPKNSRKTSHSSQPPVEPSAEIIAEVRTVLARMLELMNFPAELEVASEPGKISVEITSEFSENLVSGDGQPLDGLQYLLRKIIGRKFPEKIIVFLDSGGFRARRKAELEETARALAAEVKAGGKNRTIFSLNPAERRIVHMALQEDKAVRSRSIGDGLFKKILIYPPGKGRKRSSRGKKRS